MKTVLFIESGLFGGGSFISLKKHIYALDTIRIKPIVVFFNDNQLVKEFRDKGIRVYIVCDTIFTNGGSKTHKFANALFMKGYYKFLIISFLGMLHKRSIREISSICLKESVDVIHLNTELFRDRVGLLVGANLNLPIIAHLRSKYELGSIYFNKKYIEFANRFVQKYIAVSKDTADFWTNRVGISSERCQVLYDYYDRTENIESITPLIRKRPVFLCVANLIPVKAHDFLIKSLAPILIKKNAILQLVGQGEKSYEVELKQLTKKLGIEDHVDFLGFRNDVPLILANSDIVFLLSKREGLPNILIEALGLGCVVVATNVGGIPEIISNGINGFTVAYGNELEVRRTVEYIVNNTGDLKRIQENAKETVNKYFNIDDYKDITRELYEKNS